MRYPDRKRAETAIFPEHGPMPAGAVLRKAGMPSARGRAQRCRAQGLTLVSLDQESRYGASPARTRAHLSCLVPGMASLRLGGCASVLQALGRAGTSKGFYPVSRGQAGLSPLVSASNAGEGT